jgi:hypothetical protein
MLLRLSLLFAHIALHHIVGVIHDVTCQAEVTDLSHTEVCQEDVPSCNVPVDTLRQTERESVTVAYDGITKCISHFQEIMYIFSTIVC